MKAVAALVLPALFVISTATPAHAQFGALGKIKKGADQAADAKQKYDDWNITDAEERQLGEAVSVKLRGRFGVMQDAAVTKYVTLVGSVLAQGSTRPALEWKFIVLDTDGVNAYAAPGGFIHITRGLLGLLKNEAELAGVLGHEITHVTKKHTIAAIKQGKELDMGAGAVGKSGGLTTELLAKLGDKAFQKIFAGQFSQADENEADSVGVELANKAGYAPAGLAEALQKVSDRNANTTEQNGFFVSHPVIKDRISKINKEIKTEKLTSTAVVEARYKSNITFDAKPLSEVTIDVSGAAGLASGGKKADEKKDDKPEEKKKGGLSSITGGKQQASNQQTASAGARGATPDRDAKGGGNPNAINVKVGPAEITAFKKGIA